LRDVDVAGRLIFEHRGCGIDIVVLDTVNVSNTLANTYVEIQGEDMGNCAGNHLSGG
jgi:hypothetical protein